MLKKIKKVVEKNPNKNAYIYDSESITYEQLWNKAHNLADLLKRQGSSPVIIYGYKEIYVVISIIACLIAKRTYVPIGTCMPLYRIKKIVDSVQSTLIITESNFNIDGIDCLSIKELEKYKENEIISNDNDIAYIIYTSGSTGDAKGVPITYDNLNNFIDWISNLKPLKDYKDIKVLNQASFSFDLSVADFYYSICNGHTLYAIDMNIQKDMEIVFDTIKEVNLIVVTPTFIKMCLLNHEFNELNYPNLKCIYSCGEKLEVNTVKKITERFSKIKIINAYGPTEATSAVCAITITKEMIEKYDTLPVGDINNLATDVSIVNDEIVLKGKSVFGGYLSNIKGGYYKENNINCYKTGDIGYIEDNMLFCKGRLDNQIKYMGYRIELNDIENNINKIEGVKECITLASYNDEGIVKTIKAYVICDDNLTPNIIKKELSNKIPNYMIPKTIKILKSFPINENGKVDRKELSKL